ncbi:hypothetical protein [Streptomyces sp. NPDC056544]|uniref:hypothetical protein n=1 Tax=unclassified Streptomyces TaxID=2593676 RepID=UPI003676FDB9
MLSDTGPAVVRVYRKELCGAGFFVRRLVPYADFSQSRATSTSVVRKFSPPGTAGR